MDSTFDVVISTAPAISENMALDCSSISAPSFICADSLLILSTSVDMCVLISLMITDIFFSSSALLSESFLISSATMANPRPCSPARSEVDTPYGRVRMKVSSEGAYAPEYEDCRKLARESGAPLKAIIAEANYAYLNRSR